MIGFGVFTLGEEFELGLNIIYWYFIILFL